MIRPWIPKEDETLPDSYKLSVTYIDGTKKEWNVAGHTLRKDAGLLELVTFDDEWVWVAMNNVKFVEFDRSFSKVVDAKERKLANAK